LPCINGRYNELIPVVRWNYIENAASAIINRNYNASGTVIVGKILYKPLPDIERG
jgi:hypothetical protein